MILTELNRLFGVDIPLLNAPMTPQAGGALARAVCEAGALGMLGFDEDETLEQIGEQLALLKTDNFSGPFGVGLVGWVLERTPQLLDLAIAARPAFISISFGDPAPYIAKVHAAGILAGAQVQSRAWAQTALDAGADILVAQGTEAGGHTGRVGTLPLLQIVLEMTDRPVLAAGGVATGRGMAAALAAGAAGVWVGTPFLLASESRSTPAAQAKIIESDETQTQLTSVYDRAQGKPWPADFSGRALRNQFLDRWHGHEDQLFDDPSALTDFRRAKGENDYTRANIYAGQSVGLIDRTRPAAQIVRDIADEAQVRLAAVSGLLT
ncbi:MAG: nitronate monooxygenase [Candidatus Eremiobacteraeota bacterium]|nr:nitronate monooxygenase [Candidatus Eremiobacteraeota bacterium]